MGSNRSRDIAAPTATVSFEILRLQRTAPGTGQESRTMERAGRQTRRGPRPYPFRIFSDRRGALAGSKKCMNQRHGRPCMERSRGEQCRNSTVDVRCSKNTLGSEVKVPHAGGQLSGIQSQAEPPSSTLSGPCSASTKPLA